MTTAPVSELTLEGFRGAAASGESVPAGVAVCAVSASFALGLLAKVVKVSGRRKGFTGDPSKAENIADAARAESRRMLQFAEDDMAAFNAYMATSRLPQTTEREKEERKRAMDASVRKAIEMPVAAATTRVTRHRHGPRRTVRCSRWADRERSCPRAAANGAGWRCYQCGTVNSGV
jgi:formiminotetrahydrofolate cyclodeaminase